MNQTRQKSLITTFLLIVGICLLAIGLLSCRKNNADKHNEPSAEATTEDWDYGYDEESISLYFDENYYSTSDQIKTYLFMGTDASGTGDELEGTKDYRGTLADFLLLVVVNKTQNNYGFLQIDRNTITEVDVLDENNKANGSATEQICTAHWYGTDSEAGCENTVNAVSYYLGDLEMDGYYALGMENMGTLNHLIGGVEVTLEDDFTDQDPAMKKGTTLVLNDKQSEIFIRSRMSMKDDTNVNRMSRQRQYMDGFLAKLKEEIKTNPNCVNDIFDQLEESADTNLTNRDISRLVNDVYKAESQGILTIEGETKEGTILGDGEVHEEFYPDNESLIKTMCQLMNLTKDEE